MEEIDLIEVFKIFWRKKIQIILITLIFAGIGYMYTTRYVTPMYTSTTTLVLASQNENTTNTTTAATDVSINTKLVSTYKELITSKNILEEVIKNTGANMTDEELRKNITVTSVTNTSLIEINVTDQDPNQVVKITNEISNVFVKKISEIYNINNIQIVDEAETPTAPSNINHKKDIIIFAIIGLIVSFVYVIISNMIDTTIKSTEELEKMFDVPILVSIPMYGNRKTKGGK